MIIAVDFDGTIVEHRYPEIGREIPFAVETLKKLIEDRHQLILWSVREGRLLDEAVEWCRQRGVEFYAVNKDFPEEDTDKNRHYSRKLKADLFIDDRNLGGLPDWGTIYRMIKEKKSMAQLLQEEWEEDQPVAQKKKKRWWFLTSIPFSFRTLYIKKVSILIIKMVITEITTASVPGF